jgi:internalin A
VTDLQPLAQLRGLTQLSLDLSLNQVSDLQPLAQLKDLTQLSLDLKASDVTDLQPLAQLKGLKQLSLSLREVSNLQLVQEFTNLQILSIKDATRAQRMSLRSIPASLVELKF